MITYEVSRVSRQQLSTCCNTCRKNTRTGNMRAQLCALELCALLIFFFVAVDQTHKGKLVMGCGASKAADAPVEHHDVAPKKAPPAAAEKNGEQHPYS